MKEIKAHDYKNIYSMLGYNLSKLGCLMLDTEPILLPSHIIQDWETGSGVNFDTFFKELYMYKSENKDRFWINGYVSGDTPHVTLFYGFLQEAKCFKPHIEELLKDSDIGTVKIESIDYFDSPYEDEEYYCIVANIEKTPELLYAHNKMTLLPNIQTFPEYKPHITIAYLKKDEHARNIFIEDMSSLLVGKELKVTGLNYGGNK